MVKKINNLPAFPVESFQNKDQGMSKRFYAACSAMQGILSSLSDKESVEDYKQKAAEMYGTIKMGELIAKESFKMADELLKQEFNNKKNYE